MNEIATPLEPRVRELTWEEFNDEFRIIANHLGADDTLDMFDTHGEEFEFVRKRSNSHPGTVWTYMEDGSGGTMIGDGLHFVNRLGYIITETPAEPLVTYVIDREPCEPEVIYLTNALGEETGHGPVEEEDCAKVPFEDGPGVVLPYLAEIDGEVCVLGNLEVAFKDEFWGDDGADLKPEEEVKTYCEAACDYIRPRLEEGMQLLQIDGDDPGRFIVRIVIPLKGLKNHEEVREALARAFGAAAELPDEIPAVSVTP